MRLRGSKAKPNASMQPHAAMQPVAVEELPVEEALEELETTSAPNLAIASVNLLPRTYARRAALRRAKLFAVCAVVVAALIGTVLWMVAWQNATTAQEELDAATAQRAALQAEVARYAEVPKVLAEVDSAKAQLALAMGNEVRWSFFMNDIALMIPANVSLDTMNMTSLAPGAVPTSAEVPGAAAFPSIGQWVVSGKTFTFDNAAHWLDTVAKVPTLGNPQLGGLTESEEQGVEVVPFETTANITTSALSGRYSTPEVTR